MNLSLLGLHLGLEVVVLRDHLLVAHREDIAASSLLPSSALGEQGPDGEREHAEDAAGAEECDHDGVAGAGVSAPFVVECITPPMAAPAATMAATHEPPPIIVL